MDDSPRVWMFQSTLPTRGSDIYRGCMVIMACVSIHAPHEGERPRAITPAVAIKTFQSTLPTRGSDAMPDCVWRAGALFQSTLPTRGSDKCQRCPYGAALSFNPRSPRGGATMGDLADLTTEDSFNPRSPRGGATAEKCICMQHFREFAEYYPLRHGDARCIAPQDCIIQAFFGAKKRCFLCTLVLRTKE